MGFFDSSKSIAENLYFLSSLLVLLSIIVAIFQLHFSRKTLIINSRRDAAALAARQVEIYLNQIILLQNRFFMMESENGNIAPKIKIGDFNIDYLLQHFDKKTIYELVEKRSALNPYMLSVLNSMEAFAVYFNKGIADEEIAFVGVGRTFIFTVESLYFDIAALNSKNDNHVAFKNVIDLYQLWNSRMRKEKLLCEHKKIFEEMSKISITEIDAIGTK